MLFLKLSTARFPTGIIATLLRPAIAARTLGYVGERREDRPHWEQQQCRKIIRFELQLAREANGRSSCMDCEG
jgi:hypothetical protein